MSSTSILQEPAVVAPSGKDRTGRSRLVSNVLFTWGGQMVFFVSGFIMPRMIDHKLGREVLGVWDFSWSLVAYFKFVEMGVTSSVNRFVARYWGTHDIEGINRVVSSATLALVIAAGVILLGTIGAVVTVPYWFGSDLKGYLSVTQGSVFWLGAMLSAQTALGAFNGVLTGCHRWELQTMRNSLWQFITVVGMLTALWLGFGLVAVAAITAICQIFGQLTMVTLAYRACPGLSIKRSYVHKGTIKELYIYSGKTLLPTGAEMLLNQTISVMIVGALGPAALAIFTRPRALLRQLDSLERKMGMILIPTTSSMEGQDDKKGIVNLLIKGVRYSLYLALPFLLVLIVFGGFVMRIWMGPDYAIDLIPAILAIGFIGVTVQEPVLAILIGLNAHGRGGLAQLIASIVSVILAFVLQRYFHAGLVGMAVAITVPLLIISFVYLPWMVCRHLEMNLGMFFRDAMGQPMLHMLPFLVSLIIARMTYQSYPLIAVLSLAAGTVSLLRFYWRSVLPDRMKNGLVRFITRKVHGKHSLPQ